MSKFSEDIVSTFVKNSEDYFKKRIDSNRFYSQKLKTLVTIQLTTDEGSLQNCIRHKVEGMFQCFEILEELDVFNLEVSKSNFELLYKDMKFPCIIKLCDKSFY